MKNVITFIAVSLALLACSNLTSALRAAGETATVPEYATLRWDGRDNTHVIYPGGKVEFLGTKFKDIKKPDRADARSFFMNLAMNALAREGYKLVAMTPDDYVFLRTVTR